MAPTLSPRPHSSKVREPLLPGRTRRALRDRAARVIRPLTLEWENTSTILTEKNGPSIDLKQVNVSSTRVRRQNGPMATDSPRPTSHGTRPNSFGARSTLAVGGQSYEIHRINAEALTSGHDVARLPYSIKVLLENLLRHEDGAHVSADDIAAVAGWGRSPERHGAAGGDAKEIALTPERVLMQDFTGVPAVVDLAAMRDALAKLGGNAAQVNPLVPVELVIDHSVIAERSGTPSAYGQNVEIEYDRNIERYQLLRWAQGAFDGFRVVPPGTGICHQVNLEYLSRVVFATTDGQAFCDTLVGTDSHTTMVNGLGVLGWGVGGIEAEAAMLGQPLSMLLPPVVGLRLSGELNEGTTATDVVLTVTELLRRHGVVGKFVECYGPGVASLPLENRATIGNMTPEYGATCTIFPIDGVTIDYLRFTGRDEEHLALVEAYAKEQGMWHEPGGDEPIFSETLSLDLSTVVPSLAGPARPQDRVSLPAAGSAFRTALDRAPRHAASGSAAAPDHATQDGDVVVAAITSCTNTSNPQVMVAAGLLAKKAVERGLTSKPWVKTSLAPGSRVVMDYLEKANLNGPLDALGFYLVGFGCTTCIGNSGPLLDGITDQVKDHELSVVSVLSGNRNFEGRIHPDVRMNYLTSPPWWWPSPWLGPSTSISRPNPWAMTQREIPSTWLISGPACKRSTTPFGPASPRRCSELVTPRSLRATSFGRASRSPRARPSPGPTIRPTSRTLRTSKA